MKADRKFYQSPCIQPIPIDNEISLVLSTPPWGPDEMNQQGSVVPDVYTCNPLHT